MSRAAGEERKRLFVACSMPAEVREALTAWQQEQLAPHPEMRVTASPHVTLCFLGDIAVGDMPAILAALERVVFAAFTVAFEEAVFLPERGSKHVVALRLADPSGQLGRLQADVGRALAETGLYELLRRPFLAHVTVARYRRHGHPFSLQNVNIPAFGVDRIVLYSSVLERAGAVHTAVADFPASQ